MSPRRSIVERLMPAIVPKNITGFAPPPERIDTNLWSLERRARMPGGLILPTRTTIVALKDGGLLVVSPPPVECGGLESLDALGPVRHVLVPNAFHYLNARGFLQRHPQAELWVTPGLFARVAGLPPGTEIDESTRAPWSDAVEHAILQTTPTVSEVALFHRESATLILTDLAFHLVRFASAFERIAWRMTGVPRGFGHSRTARLMLLGNRTATGPFVRRLLEWPFRRILVGHGDAVEDDAIGAFRRAFSDYLH